TFNGRLFTDDPSFTDGRSAEPVRCNGCLEGTAGRPGEFHGRELVDVTVSLFARTFSTFMWTNADNVFARITRRKVHQIDDQISCHVNEASSIAQLNDVNVVSHA